jgi:SPP1 family phage portal protein
MADLKSDLKTVFDAIMAKRTAFDVYDEYFEGQQPTPYLTKRMREIFKGVVESFTANWCAVVISACDERINLTGFESSDKKAEDTLAAAWDRNSMALEAADVHTDSLVLGECYAIVWPGADGKAEVYYNDPRMIHCVYAADNPRKVTMAGKLWIGEDGNAKLTLYYPDHLEYYSSTKEAENASSSEAFMPDLSASPDGKADNPYGQVPVFHFKINRHCQSDLKDVLPLQNGINKLLADMMVAAEFGAYSQRWIISNADTGGLKNSPGEVWTIPAGDGTGQQTSVGTFQSTDLKNYLDAIDRLSMAIGVITRTPKHYFFTQAGDPSGEALIALEAPLNKKAQDRIDRFRPTWRDVAAFICKIEGVAVKLEAITPQFEKPETVQPKTTADITKVRVDSGVPLDTALTWEGKTDSEIETMNKIKDEGASKAQAGLAASLLKAQQDFKTQPMPQTGVNNQQTNQPITMPMNGGNNRAGN